METAEDLLTEPNLSSARSSPGKTLLKRGTRITGLDRAKLADDLKKQYESGVSIRALAAATGRSYGFVFRILTENGVSLRGRGEAAKGKPGRNSERKTTRRALIMAAPAGYSRRRARSKCHTDGLTGLVVLRGARWV